MDEVFDKMKSIASLASSMKTFYMRNSRNPTFSYSQAEFGRILMCIYNIHDTINALAYYLDREEENHQGARYLLICGAFQSLCVQQDAVSFLRMILLENEKKIDWRKDYPTVGKIRDYRNRYFGHPTEGKEQDQFHVGAFMPTSNSLVEVRLHKAEKVQDVYGALGLENVNVHDAIKEQTLVLYDIMLYIWKAVNEKRAKTARA